MKTIDEGSKAQLDDLCARAGKVAQTLLDQQVQIGHNMDKQISVLSTAVIGFLFAYIPYSELWTYSHLYQTSAFAFALALVTTILGFWIATKNYGASKATWVGREVDLQGLNYLLLIADSKNATEQAREDAFQQFTKSREEFFGSKQWKGESRSEQVYGYLQNTAFFIRNISFLAGVICLTIYVICNLEEISSKC